MQYGDNTSFLGSLKIQGRVIGALLMREIITRYGRRNLGFLWLFVEPLLLTITIVTMWKIAKADKFSDLNIIAFAITGYPMAMMWRNASQRSMGAVSANTSLLYHRNVRVLDTLLSRVLLEIAGATIAQLFITAVLIFLGFIDPPNDTFYMLLAWVLMALFAFGLGLILSAIAFYFEPFQKIWSPLSFVLLPISGAFFFAYSLPPTLQKYALYIPMVHGTEMFRHGYFGPSVTTLEDPFYLLFCDLVLIFVGLTLVRKYSKEVQA